MRTDQRHVESEQPDGPSQSDSGSVSGGGYCFAFTVAFLNLVPSPAPFGYLVLEKYSVAAKVGVIRTVIAVVGLIATIVVTFFTAALRAANQDVGTPSPLPSSFLFWTSILLYAPLFLAHGLSAWDAWRIARGGKGVFG